MVLTSKGFSLLQKTPEAVDSTVDRRSYFERLKSATISGAKAVAAESIGAVVARLLGAGQRFVQGRRLSSLIPALSSVRPYG